MMHQSDRKPYAFFKSIRWCWILVMLCCFLLPAFAAADVLPCDGTPVGLLHEGDALHLLYQDRCCMVTPEHTLAPCPLHCESTGVMFCTMVTPQGHTYGLDGYGQLYRWTPEENVPWKPIIKLEFSPRSLTSSTVYVAGEDMVYEAAQDENGVWILTAYRINAGTDTVAGTELFRESDPDMKPVVQPDGSLALATGDTYSTAIIKRVESGGRSTTLASPDRTGYSGIISDGKDGWIVLEGSELYAMSNEGTSTLLNYVPHFMSSFMTALVPCFDNEIAFITQNDDVSVLTIVSLTQQEQTVLRIGGYSSWVNSHGILDFEIRHPGVVVVEMEYPATFEEVAQVITRDETFCDVYILRTVDDDIRNMLRKGYYTDLSDSVPISEFIAGLYPIWQREVTVNGQPAALPLAVTGSYGLGYNKALWEELSLGDVPTTWDEMLDCIECLYNDGVLDEYPLFAGSLRSAKRLLYLLLEGNAALYERDGQPVQYHNAKLLPQLEHLKQLTPLLDDHDAHKPEGDELFYSGLDVGIRSPWSYTAAFVPLRLGFDAPDDYAQLAEIVAAVIDPLCKQQELAQDFLATLLDTMDTPYRIALTDVECPGIESPAYAEGIAIWQADLAAREAALAEARANKDEQGIRDNKEWIEILNQYLAEAEDNRWIISPEAAADYRAEVASYAMYRANGVELIYNNAGATFDSLLDGKLIAEDFVRRLDQIVNMWTMENQ